MALYTTSRQGNGDSDNGCGDSKLRLVTITLLGHTRVFDLGKDLMFLCLSNYSHLNFGIMITHITYLLNGKFQQDTCHSMNEIRKSLDDVSWYALNGYDVSNLTIKSFKS